MKEQKRKLNNKVVIIFGTRPQFVKLAPLLKAFNKTTLRYFVINTGQHFDANLSSNFLKEFNLKKPSITLNIHGGSPSSQVSRMINKLEKILIQINPAIVTVLGDTNSTLAGAITASQLRIPVAHIESGMRSFNLEMQEEINRRVTDHLSTIHFCSSKQPKTQLRKEGINKNVIVSGDIMLDTLKIFSSRMQKPFFSKKITLRPKKFILCTVHRSQNSDNKENLIKLVNTLEYIKETCIFPLHPRTRKSLIRYGLWEKFKKNTSVHIAEPLPYFSMLWLEKNARVILTDSGGIQKEAYAFRTPCVTLRNETEWVETVKNGWNRLVGMNQDKILKALKIQILPKKSRAVYGDGNTAKKISQALIKFITNKPYEKN